jgi:surface polysaccharide O-acyltransferase-like enzyme
LFAIFGVIVIHCDVLAHDVFTSGAAHLAEATIDGSGRLAVPFFFVVSGYFFGRKIRSGTAPLALFVRYARRLLLVWILWSLIYLFLPLQINQWTDLGWWPAVMGQLQAMVDHPLHIVWVGGKGHLWFLMALVMALAILAVCERWRVRGAFYVLAVLLYLFGLVAGLYGHTLIGLHMPFDTRNGPFMSALLVGCGFWASAKPRHFPPVAALALAAIGWLGFEAELHWIPMVSSAWPPIIDYGIFTPVFGLGALLFALSRPALGGHFWPRVGARYVLGVYVCQDLFIEPMWPLHAYFHSYAWEFLFPVVVLALSLGLTALLYRTRWTRYLVA